VDRRWPTNPDRRFRAIAGNSAGAFGAVNVGLRHLDTFGIIESWSGYYTQTPTGPFKHASKASLRANSPAAYVGALKPALARLPLHAFLYGGAKDPDTKELASFAAQLGAAGADVRRAVWPGRHDWRLWRDRTPSMLLYLDRMFGR
jgi:enterochelin esterase-like enzyme